ncbi:zinc ribbon protein [Natranaerovirga hydrolytica]|uniref:Zinc ribbon protein n=1 Tax=Natranaerovirga hydrolytica TaxID=680378 RepID=A0A4R1N3W6_9FIRM|nr:zinc ribbon domain-containing protein [Natranaerovirga hydrolytica]TCK98764.1 zinc ribbon protein [Natranaerovirga hydrolytica]
MSDFFEKLKGEFKRVGAKSSTMLEVNKIKSEISALNRRKKDAFAVLGEKIYKMKKDDTVDFDKLKEDYDKIDVIVNAIHAKKKEIQDLEENMTDSIIQSGSEHHIVCQCGQPIEEDAKFCTACGKKVDDIINEEPVFETTESVDNNEAAEAIDEAEEPIEQSTDKQTICECGETIEDDAKFCTSCGQQVE